jgi:hypothetical protein
MTLAPWSQRPLEQARLLNPAFVGTLLWPCARAYQTTAAQPQPYALSFLMAPVVLHKSTRERLSTTTRTSIVLISVEPQSPLAGSATQRPEAELPTQVEHGHGDEHDPVSVGAVAA